MAEPIRLQRFPFYLGNGDVAWRTASIFGGLASAVFITAGERTGHRPR